MIKRNLSFYKEGCFFTVKTETEYEWQAWLYALRCMVFGGVVKTKREAWKIRVMCFDDTEPKPIIPYWENPNYVR